MSKSIYLDNQSTTPIDPKVLDAMIPFFVEKFGNASSVQHSYGQESKDAVEKARSLLANAINAQEREIIFTSGATEAINLAIKGIAETYTKNTKRGGHPENWRDFKISSKSSSVYSVVRPCRTARTERRGSVGEPSLPGCDHCGVP